MTSIADLLADHPLFEGLPPGSNELIAGCGRNAHFATGEYLLSADASADEFFVLRRGHVAIEVDTPRRGPLVVATLGEGEVLGVSWMLPPYRWTFDARAVEPTSAIALDASCLRAKCDDDPALGYELFKRFAGLVRNRLQAARLQLVDLYGNDAS
ncbi:MAG: cyclic nucleotide-binding domain-containing protein [Microthrixaceae bacterium]